MLRSVFVFGRALPVVVEGAAGVFPGPCMRFGDGALHEADITGTSPPHHRLRSDAAGLQTNDSARADVAGACPELSLPGWGRFPVQPLLNCRLPKCRSNGRLPWKFPRHSSVCPAIPGHGALQRTRSPACSSFRHRISGLLTASHIHVTTGSHLTTRSPVARIRSSRIFSFRRASAGRSPATYSSREYLIRPSNSPPNAKSAQTRLLPVEVHVANAVLIVADLVLEFRCGEPERVQVSAAKRFAGAPESPSAKSSTRCTPPM